MLKKFKLGEVNRKAQSGLAVLTIIFGFYMMWGSLSGQNKNESRLSQAVTQAIEIDTNKPSTKHIGKLVVAAGKLTSIEPIDDEFINASSALILNRKVKMFQWIERLTSPTDPTPEYILDWVEGQSDFLSFQQPEGHENPVLKYDSKLFRVSNVSFGGYDGSKILEAIVVIPELSVSREMLKDSSLKVENGEIYISRTPGTRGAHLGDMRISYQMLASGDYTIAARQADEITLVGGNVGDEIVIKPGILTAVELFSEVGNETKSMFSGLLYLGGLVFFLGIFSLLVKIVPTLDLRPKIEIHGKPAVLLVSGAISIVTVLIFSVMELVS